MELKAILNLIQHLDSFYEPRIVTWRFFFCQGILCFCSTSEDDESLVEIMLIIVILCICIVFNEQVYSFTTKLKADGAFKSQISKIEENSAHNLFERIQVANVEVPASLCKSGKIESTYSYFESYHEEKGEPIVLIHGFDSSCIEFRRIAPLLAEKHDVYAIDVLGWGFNEIEGVVDFGPGAKMTHLESLIEQVVPTQKCVVGGASLGGALAVTLAVSRPDLVSKCILIDAQGFIDGDGPKEMPDALAKFGIGVLKSWPLRMFANVLAYKDKKFATWDAMLCGRLHCETPLWMDASVDFLKSGGFVVSDLVSQVSTPSLVIWGEDDAILSPATAEQFREAIPTADIRYIPSCGHVPHLEQPNAAARAIIEFLAL